MLYLPLFISGVKPESIFSISLNLIFPNLYIRIADYMQKEGLAEFIKTNFTECSSLL